MSKTYTTFVSFKDLCPNMQIQIILMPVQGKASVPASHSAHPELG
jgi:hypothetical protein